MKHFKYKIVSKKNEEERWVCSACKKTHYDEIFLGKWKLIGMKDSANLSCDSCSNHNKQDKAQGVM